MNHTSSASDSISVKHWYHNGLGVKFVILIFIVLLITLGLTTFVNTRYQENSLKQHLIEKTGLLGHFASLISIEAVIGLDYELLNNYMEYVSNQRDIVYSVMVGQKKRPMTSYLDHNNTFIAQAIQDIGTDDLVKVIAHLRHREDITHVEFPVNTDGESIGVISVGFSVVRVDKLAQQNLIKQALTNSAIILFLSVCIYLVFRFNVLRPIRQLIKGANRIAAGTLDRPVQIHSHDEIGSLAHAFNDMMLQLDVSIREKDDINKTLVMARDSEKNANQAKTQFLANMSHELRTPLNAIIGYSEMLEEDALSNNDERTVDDLGKIKSAAHHLLQLINDILDLSKIEAGQMTLFKEATNPRVLVDEVVDMIMPLVNKRHNRFVLQFDADIQIISTDVIKLRQILFNLLSNATKFTNNGSIELNVTSHLERILFVVSDSGIGMTEQQLLVLFKPFVQGDASTTRRFGGTGLGLTISRQFSEMMGGSIKVSSEAGKGSVFTLSLPVDMCISQPSNEAELVSLRHDMNLPKELLCTSE